MNCGRILKETLDGFLSNYCWNNRRKICGEFFLFFVTNISETDQWNDYCSAVSLSGWQSVYPFIHWQQTTQEFTDKILLIFCMKLEDYLCKKGIKSFCQKEDFKGTGSSDFYHELKKPQVMKRRKSLIPHKWPIFTSNHVFQGISLPDF